MHGIGQAPFDTHLGTASRLRHKRENGHDAQLEAYVCAKLKHLFTLSIFPFVNDVNAWTARGRYRHRTASLLSIHIRDDLRYETSDTSESLPSESCAPGGSPKSTPKCARSYGGPVRPFAVTWASKR